MSNVHREYGIEISRKNFAPQQAAQAFIMQEIKGWVDEFNKNGSSEPIELDEIVIDKQ